MIEGEPLVLTNNPMVAHQFDGRLVCHFNEKMTYLDVMKTARDYVHQGYQLLSHPLSGSIKPNETPYKSIVLKKAKDMSTDFWSLSLIEEAIATTEKFNASFAPRAWPEDKKEDFQLIDCDLITDPIKKSL